MDISEDDDVAIQHQNADRVIASSFAPLFAALSTMQPSYSLLPVTLVTDRNSLRKLFNYVCVHPGRAWRIEAELVEGTLFLTRWEANSRQIIIGSLHSGHGHEFEKTFLKFEEGLEDSSSHHRIIEYEIAGMKWVVRFEADGYVENEPENKGSMVVKASQIYAEVTTATETLPTNVQSQPTMLEGIDVIQKGHLVPPDSVIEAKCIAQRGTRLTKNTPQCWFSQTRHLFVGRHKNGRVNRVDKTEMSQVFGNWEENHQDKLRELTNLVKDIISKVGETSGRKCSVIWDVRKKPRQFRILKSDDRRLIISPEVRNRFWPSV